MASALARALAPALAPNSRACSSTRHSPSLARSPVPCDRLLEASAGSGQGRTRGVPPYCQSHS
eukprot:12600757-Alexandrium_andersonii.AAC.1